MTTIKLCYQEYETRVTFDAHREFLKRHDKSLGYYIGKVLSCNLRSKNLGPLDRMDLIQNAVPYVIALDIFDVVTDKKITKQELDDAMFRVDWLPTERDGDLGEPWTFVLAQFANEYSEAYNQISLKKN